MIKMNEIFKLLEKAGLSPKLKGSTVRAECPVHGVGHRYLRIIEKDSGLIMWCRARCTKNQMRETGRNFLGLSPDDLSFKRMKPKQQDLSQKEDGDKTIFRASPEQYLQGEPGEYSVECIHASKRPRQYGRYKITLVFRVISGEQEGSIVLLYMELGGKNVWASSTYSMACCIALGRSTRPKEDLSPETVFVGKQFIAYIGRRRREPRGNKANKVNFLRVHRLLRLL